jgi:predicted ribonuclease YlaK
MGDLFQGMRNQANPLRELADEIEQYAKIYRSNVGWSTAVVDTSALGVLQPPWQVPWAKVIGAPNVRVVLPLRVVEELDKYKYGEGARMHDVARKLIPELERRLTGESGTRATVGDHVWIDVLIPPGKRDRTLHADEEILQTAEDLRQFGNQNVIVVADDIAMRIQARARHLGTVGIDTKYRRQRPDQDEAQEFDAVG